MIEQDDLLTHVLCVICVIGISVGLWAFRKDRREPPEQ